MQASEIYHKFYKNYVKNFMEKYEKAVPPDFSEWLRFDKKLKLGIYATRCPICSSKDIVEGVKLDTKGTIFRDSIYIEYYCRSCDSYFLI
ncbi:MAG: hypothetical protein ACTSPQ_01665 [Candidatus Helarchaeota archaeon]